MRVCNTTDDAASGRSLYAMTLSPICDVSASLSSSIYLAVSDSSAVMGCLDYDLKVRLRSK